MDLGQPATTLDNQGEEALQDERKPLEKWATKPHMIPRLGIYDPMIGYRFS